MVNNNKTLRTFCSAAALVITFVTNNPAVADGVVHKVSVGSPDVCEAFDLKPGCDASWSMTAVQFEDGTVTGKIIDRSSWGWGVDGTVTCLVVDGNEAWISGTAWFFGRGKAFEFPFFARVVDNGVSANDEPDEISYLMWRADDCEWYYENARYDEPVFPAPQGQVTVK